MLRRAGLVALAAVVLAAAVAALATASGRASDDRRLEVIKLDFRAGPAVEIDLAEEGFGLGDRFAFADDLRRDGASVGVLAGDCVIVGVGEPFGARAQCAATVSLADGQITAQGLITFTEDPVQRFGVAVTGGTGDYRTARGEARVEERPEEGEGRIAITLLR